MVGSTCAPRKENLVTIQICVRESLLARLHDSRGTKMFRRLYARVDGCQVDLAENGNKSCALFASTVLVGFGLVRAVHVTVEGLLRDLGESGWESLRQPRRGCVVVWRDLDPQHPSLHVGFYLGNGQAVSNSSITRSPRIHPYRGRKVELLYWSAKLV